MVPSPAKKQRKRVLSDSDDHKDGSTTRAKHKHVESNESRLPTRSRKQPTQSASSKEPKGASQPGAKTSRQKVSADSKQEKLSAKPISAFFGHGSQVKTQKENAVTGHQRRESDLSPSQPQEEEDGIEDSSEGSSTRVDARPGKPAGSQSTRTVQARKPGQGLPSGSQRFRIRQNHVEVDGKSSGGSEPDQRPWADRFGPSNLEELVVHKKKILDVQKWLQDSLHKADAKKVLVMKGPSGAGKTTTLRLLAQAMDVNILEWKNPVGSDMSSEAYVSLSAQFGEFLGRSLAFHGLEVASVSTSKDEAISQEATNASVSIKPKLVLIEEFPNMLGSTSIALQSFRQNILGYLAACSSLSRQISFRKDADTMIAPMILIITESRLNSGGSQQDNFTVNKILGPEILSHPALSVIEFNSVAVTFVRKAFDLVIQKEARISGRRRVPGPAVLQNLSAVGDVRSAIGSLEFLCLNTHNVDNWSGRVAAVAKRGAKESDDITQMERALLQMVTPRETKLEIFHAVGKIVYNKRMELKNAPLAEASSEFSDDSNARVPEVSLDRLMDQCETDVETFVAALHENYVLSCHGSSFTDAVEGCLDALSNGDILGLDARYGRSVKSFRSSASATDTLRQDEMVFQLVTRGILFSLPYPVKRAPVPVDLPGMQKSKAFGHKMFYPTSMRLGRQIEEIEDMLEAWQLRGQQASTTVENRAITGFEDTDTITHSDHDNIIRRRNMHCAKSELVSEILPYTCMIQNSRRGRESSDKSLLERITQFRGTSIAEENGDASGEEDNDNSGGIVGGGTHDGSRHLSTDQAEAEAEAEAAEKILFLPEDDIEDE